MPPKRTKSTRSTIAGRTADDFTVAELREELTQRGAKPAARTKARLFEQLYELVQAETAVATPTTVSVDTISRDVSSLKKQVSGLRQLNTAERSLSTTATASQPITPTVPPITPLGGMPVATKENVFSLKGASDRLYYVDAYHMVKDHAKDIFKSTFYIENYKLHTFITNSPTEPMTEAPQNLHYEFPLLNDDAMDVLVDFLKTGHLTALWCKHESGTTKVVDIAAALMKTDEIELYRPFMGAISSQICPSNVVQILAVTGCSSFEIRLSCIDVIVQQEKSEGRKVDLASLLTSTKVSLEEKTNLLDEINQECANYHIHLTERIQVFVRTLTGKTKTFKVSPVITVGRLMLKIRNTEGIPLDQQRLIFDGIQLNEMERTLRAYNVTPLSTVHLVLRLKGC